MKKTVITYGTFDMFHIGHLRLLQRLKDYGEKIIVGVSTDEFNEKKGKKCIIPYKDRAEIIENIIGVDMVIPEKEWSQKVIDIKNYNVDCFIMGDDWSGKFDELKSYCEVIYLPRTTGISTTSLKSSLSITSPELKKDIDKAFILIESIRKNLTY
ncbi:adenylyltransferase/cytidyltransferase family protein [Thiothrix lacustris]|uniref:Adenylyltransferase/cytidyltransferase family protein n=1 Tax=Thiothrix lacustris TaxID=525917 RepID=A0ABY9MQF7_9GAMM|nr:adenylyltransferase/cytidyltransferase family protein [Thiothrix lacustris]WML90405.1 adenylyltransferase/cytidyltransferase family protein [Thiothrix lacustris]